MRPQSAVSIPSLAVTALPLLAALYSAQSVGTAAFADDPVACRILVPESTAEGVYVSELWPDGIVPYEFHANVTAANQEKAIAAMAELESVAGVAFVPHDAQPNWILIQTADNNSSFVGMQGGEQLLNIVSWNSPNSHYIIVHELIHALGAWHEQQRPDRDDVVQINWDNIQPGFEHNFEIESPVTTTGPYDFDSLMHYGDCTFSICCAFGTKCTCLPGCETITVLPPNESWQDDIGQRDHLSSGDIAGLVQMYPCDPSGTCPCDDLSLGSIVWEESGGDNDGTPECGEAANVQITLCTSADVQSVNAILFGASQCVELTDSDVSYGTIVAGQCATVGDFNMNIVAADSCFGTFALHVEYEQAGIPCFQDFFFNRFFCCAPDCEQAFELCETEITVIDSYDCNGNGSLDSGERAEIRVSLQNIGQLSAFDPDAWLSCPGEIQLDCGPFQELRYPDLFPGAPCVFPEEPSSPWEVQIPKNVSGTWDANVHVTYDGASEPYLIPNPVTITAGTQGWIDTVPPSYDFGVIGSDQDVMVDVTLSNVGTAPFTVTDIVTSHPDTTWIGGPPLQFTVAPGESVVLTIVIDTTLLSCSQISRQVTFQSDACVDDEDDQITITGLVCDAWPVFGLLPSVTTFNTGPQQVDIGGATVVWSDGRNGNSDIYANDLMTRTEFAVTTHPADQYDPRVSGTKVAWSDRRNAPAGKPGFDDIYAFDLGDGIEFPVSTDPADERLVGINGDYIAYRQKYYEMANEPDPYNLYLYNCATGQTLPVTTFTHDGFNPMGAVSDVADIGGGLLTWWQYTYVWNGNDWEWSDRKIRIYDIADAKVLDEIAIGGTNGLSTNNGKVVWSWDACGDDNVFLWEGGSVEQITCFDDEHELPAIGCAAIVYRLHLHPDYPLLYWDLDSSQEAIILPSANIDPNVVDGWRMGADPCDVLVYRVYDDNIYYAFINRADPSVSPAGIQSSSETPYEDRPFEIVVTVSNLTIIDAPAFVTVQLYDGDPDDPGALPLGEQVIPNLPGQSQIEVVFPDVQLNGARAHPLFVRLIPSFADNPANNTAYLDVDVLAPGNCCLDDLGTCMDNTTPSECTASGGIYQGDGSNCVNVPCAVLGACCFVDQTCNDNQTENSCIGFGGEFQGAATVCGPEACPVPCPWDCADGDGIVGIADFLVLLTQWGQSGTSCDLYGTGVGIVEFLDLLVHWGSCP